jgi:hypothetical protein
LKSFAGEDCRTIVSGAALARHLDFARPNLERLISDRVIERLADGRYDLDASRVRYLRHLRNLRRQSPGSAAQQAHTEAKTRLLALRVAERERRVVPVENLEAMIDGLCSLMNAKLFKLPARIGGADLRVRRRAEKVVHDVLKEIAERALELEAKRDRKRDDDGERDAADRA